MRNSFITHLFSFLAVGSLLIAMTGQGHAQINDGPDQRPDLWTKVQDSVWIFLPEGGDTLDPDLVSGSYEFTMQYDSTCLTRYVFTEPWHNGRRLKLMHWELGQSVNLGEDLLSLNSYTESFTLHAGDTVSFFRSFRWFDARTWQQDTANFFSRDTLTYSIELANAHDSARRRTRLVVIDSFGVMPQVTPGRPRFFGMGNRGVMALVKYVVPPSMNGKPAFMRVRVRARGSGDYHFTRTDQITANMSGLLDLPEIAAHVSVLNEDRFWKPVAAEDREHWMATQVMMVHSTENAAISIRLLAAPDLDKVSVAIHDAQGVTLATPFSGVLDQERTLLYTPSSSGTYFVVISNGERILHTEKLLITK